MNPIARRGLITGSAAVALYAPLRKALAAGASLPPVSIPAIRQRLRNLGSAALRAPTPLDDASRGYAIGDLWLSPDRSLYKALRVTSGTAVWQRQNGVIPRPGNVTTGLAAAYGVRRLFSAYAGPALKVERVSDTTSLDIGFAADGTLDLAAYNGFLTGTTGRVITWYDQTGNGNHATAASGSTGRPVATSNPFFGSTPAVLHETDVSVNGVGGKIKQSLSIPNTLTLTSNSVSVLSLCSFRHVHRNAPIIELSGATPLNFGQSNQLNALASKYTAVKSATAFRPPINAGVVGFASGTSNFSLLSREGTQVTSPAIAGTALAGGIIGGATTFFIDGNSDPDYGNTAQGAILIYNRALSLAEYQAVAASLYYHFEAPPQSRGTIICDGDSITEGAFQTEFQNYARRALPFLDGSPRIFCTGVSGGTVQTQIAAIPRWINALAEAAPYKLVTLFAGTNNLVNGDTAASTFSAMQTYVSTVKASAPDAQVCLATPIVRSNLSTDPKATERTNLINLVRNQFASIGAAGAFDFAADVTMGDQASIPGFFADGTHPNAAGTDVNTEIYINAMNSYVR